MDGNGEYAGFKEWLEHESKRESALKAIREYELRLLRQLEREARRREGGYCATGGYRNNRRKRPSRVRSGV